MKRRTITTLVSSAVVGTGGCLSSDGGGSEPTQTETADHTPTPRSTATRSPTRTESNNRSETEASTPTPPPLTGSALGLSAHNERERQVTAVIVVESRTSEESRRFDVELDPGEEVDYRELSIMEDPVLISVMVGGETFEYEPQAAGVVFVEFTGEGVSFRVAVS